MPVITEQQAGGKGLLAFLDMIAWSEGTSTCSASRDGGYDVIVTGVDGAPEIFTDFSQHPFANGRKSKVINSKGLTSNASGRYQFMLHDWLYYKAMLRLPDFSPLSQDRWALQLIRERGAFPCIAAGNVTDAITRCSNIWASLPGANYPGQRMHQASDLIAVFRKSLGALV